MRPLRRGRLRSPPWVPESGWPIPLSALDAPYEKAATYCQIEPEFDTKADLHAGESVWNRAPAGADTLQIKRFQISAPTRFGQVYEADLTAAKNVKVFLHANVLELVPTEAGDHVDHVKLGKLSGGEATVHAKAFVLCAGGIENARLLLVSRGAHPTGLANEHDLVGRYFTDHIEAMCGYAYLSQASDVLEPTPMGAPARYTFVPTFETQRAHRLLSAYFEVHRHPVPKDFLEKAGGLFVGLADDTDDLEALSDRFGLLHVHAETSPNRDSRITLIDDKDRFGVPRVKGDWRLRDGDMASVDRAMALMGAAFGARGLGRVRILTPEDEDYAFNAAHHHMGTTRMHADPARGVANADARAHSVDNLYFGGSSLFTTPGSVTPTLTIAALAVRLADHLKKAVTS